MQIRDPCLAVTRAGKCAQGEGWVRASSQKRTLQMLQAQPELRALACWRESARGDVGGTSVAAVAWFTNDSTGEKRMLKNEFEDARCAALEIAPILQLGSFGFTNTVLYRIRPLYISTSEASGARVAATLL